VDARFIPEGKDHLTILVSSDNRQHVVLCGRISRRGSMQRHNALRTLTRQCLDAGETHPSLRASAMHLGSMHCGSFTVNTHKPMGQQVNPAAVVKGHKGKEVSLLRRCVLV